MMYYHGHGFIVTCMIQFQGYFIITTVITQYHIHAITLPELYAMVSTRISDERIIYATPPTSLWM